MCAILADSGVSTPWQAISFWTDLHLCLSRVTTGRSGCRVIKSISWFDFFGWKLLYPLRVFVILIVVVLRSCSYWNCGVTERTLFGVRVWSVRVRGMKKAADCGSRHGWIWRQEALRERVGNITSDLNCTELIQTFHHLSWGQFFCFVQYSSRKYFRKYIRYIECVKLVSFSKMTPVKFGSNLATN